MTSATKTGRHVGALLLVQLAGLIVPFVLLLPLAGPDYLRLGPPAATQARIAVILLFANAILTLWIALAVYPRLRDTPRMAIALVVASGVWCVLQAVDNAHLMAMLQLATQHATDSSVAAMAPAVRALRGWAHYTELLAVNAWFLVFYAALFRTSLVPRPLAAFGMVMVAVHTLAIPFATFAGYATQPALAVSLALSHLAVGGWLLVKGFAARV